MSAKVKINIIRLKSRSLRLLYMKLSPDVRQGGKIEMCESKNMISMIGSVGFFPLHLRSGTQHKKYSYCLLKLLA